MKIKRHLIVNNMGFDFLGLKKTFHNIARLGSKKNLRHLYNIGRKMSHRATDVLGKVTTGAAAVARATQGTPVQFIAQAVEEGAKTAKQGIEIGKDVGRYAEHKDKRAIGQAKSRIPNLVNSAAMTSANIEAAALFV